METAPADPTHVGQQGRRAELFAGLRPSVGGLVVAFSALSDEQLVSEVTRRSPDAFAEIHGRHAPAVTFLARRLTFERSAGDEIAQEAFLELWNRPEGFDPLRGTLRVYLLTLTRGRAIDRARADVSRRSREEVHGRIGAVRAGVEETVLTALDSERVRVAVSRLPSRDRVPLELAFFGGHTYSVVAEILGLPEGTVKSRIRTGLRVLHADIAEG